MEIRYSWNSCSLKHRNSRFWGLNIYKGGLSIYTRLAEWKLAKSRWSRRRRCLRSVTGACELGEHPRWGTHKYRALEGCPSNKQQSMPGVGALFQSATTLWHPSGGIRSAQTTRLPSGDAFSVIERVKFLKLPSEASEILKITERSEWNS